MQRRHVIALGLFAVFGLVLVAGLRDVSFLGFDDNLYITENDWVVSGLGSANFWQVWRLDHQSSYWHPLTWLSLQLSSSIHGMWAPGFVLLNGLLHLLSATMIFLLLARVTGRYWVCLLIGLLFFVHPFQLEVVAWTVERKTALSGALMMLSLAAYGAHVRKPGRVSYLLSVLLFALALQAKPTVATLAAALMALDFWPLRRWPRLSWAPSSWRALKPLAVEKLPYLVLGTAGVGLAWWSTQSQASQVSLHTSSFVNRLSDAAQVFFRYPVDLLSLGPLAVYIPPRSSFDVWLGVPAAIGLALVLATAYRLRARAPWLLVGLLWYGIFLLPVSGLIRNGLWPDRANRFVYLPMIGLLVAVLFSVDALVRVRTAWRRPAAVLAALALLACAVTTYSYARVWRSPLTLWQHVVDNTHRNGFALRALGVVHNRAGRRDQAQSFFQKAVQVSWPAGNLEEEALGRFLVNQGNLEQGVLHLDRALSLNPGFARLWRDTAPVLGRLGRPREQIRRLNRALACRRGLSRDERLEIKSRVDRLIQTKVPELAGYLAAAKARPDDLNARARLAFLQQKLGLLEHALPQFEAMATSAADRWQAHFNLGNLLYLMGRDRAAIVALERAVALGSPYAEVYNKLGLCSRRLGQLRVAEAHFAKAMQMPDHDGKAMINLVGTLVMQGQTKDALSWLDKTQEQFPAMATEVEMRRRVLME